MAFYNVLNYMKTNAPKQGEGLHDWLLHASRDLLIKGLSREQAIEELIAAAEASHRTSQNVRVEVSNAVDGAIAYFRSHGKASTGGRKEGVSIDPTNFYFRDRLATTSKLKNWLAVNPVEREIALQHGELVLWHGVKEFDFVKLWANINFLICASIRIDRATILPLLRWLSIGPEVYQYVVPNYMLRIGGDRRVSNCGKGLYIVIEFDKDSLNDQWRLLSYLDSKLTCAMIVYSGHRSLHGWFPIFHMSVAKVRKFFRLATSIGADKMLWTPVQYVRMPNGWNRRTGRRQKVLYYNSKVIMEHNEIVRKYCL